MIHRALIDLSQDPGLDGATRGKALALAFTLGVDLSDVIRTDFKLRFATETLPVESKLDDLAKLLSGHIDSVHAEEPILPFLRDIAANAAGQDAGDTADWSHVMQSGSSGEQSVANMPVNDLPELDLGGFARRQSLILSLIHI